MTDVLVSQTARDALEELPPNVQNRIKDKLLGEVTSDPDRYCRSMTGSPYDRIRIGNYRVVVDWNRAKDELRIVDIGHRNSIYD